MVLFYRNTPRRDENIQTLPNLSIVKILRKGCIKICRYFVIPYEHFQTLFYPKYFVSLFVPQIILVDSFHSDNSAVTGQRKLLHIVVKCPNSSRASDTMSTLHTQCGFFSDFRHRIHLPPSCSYKRYVRRITFRQ